MSAPKHWKDPNHPSATICGLEYINKPIALAPFPSAVSCEVCFNGLGNNLGRAKVKPPMTAQEWKARNIFLMTAECVSVKKQENGTWRSCLKDETNNVCVFLNSVDPRLPGSLYEIFAHPIDSMPQNKEE